jgi:hypothetical protein
MSEISRELQIRGENIQRIYEFYRKELLVVNRRYQRKLIWTVEEKIQFIDSILKGYPVPLFLLADIKYKDVSRYEIIDGMQRLNAIVSFIEQEFSVNDSYFDLEAMADTKQILDEGNIVQKEPILDRTQCVNIASYPIPLSIYKISNEERIDEIFRRINSGGKHLSRQEIRQSGSLGNFANLIRKISMYIRGDSGASDILYLNAMNNISLTNRELEYGINIEEVFWVKYNILIKEKLRESRDEELICDIIGYILLNQEIGSSISILDSYYGIIENEAGEKRYIELETNLSKISPDIIFKQFLSVYEEFKKIFIASGQSFNYMVFERSRSNRNLPRYFQCVFMALWTYLIDREKKVSNYSQLASALIGIGDNINVGGGGGTWSSSERRRNIDSVRGIIEQYFVDREEKDPALNSWITEFENILTQSYTEQSLYDFKQGFHKLDNVGDFDLQLFKKVIKSLTAMANTGPNTTGYIIIGVSDKDSTKERIEKLYGITTKIKNKFIINGIEPEAQKFHQNLDNYFQYIVQLIKKEPISQEVNLQICSDIRLIKYFEYSLLIFKIKSTSRPEMYDEKYYIRSGANVDEVTTAGYESLFRRFI